MACHSLAVDLALPPVAVGEILKRAPVAHKGRHSLVEGRVVGDPDGGVGHLVENQVGEPLNMVVRHKGVEGITKEAEGAKGVDPPDNGLPPLFTQALGHPLGALWGVVAAVGNGADDREAPELAFKGGGPGGGDDRDQVVPVYLDKGGVVSRRLEAEQLFAKAADPACLLKEPGILR